MSRDLRRGFLVWLAVAFMGLALTACGTDKGPTSGSADDFTSICDEHGNLVYLSEDDTQSSPAIFVLEGACDSER